ncbi:MAG TPA: sugar phosphate nucleotidyltransferase [Caulobacteraceae bacterium]|jgi:mannose-1-phosphate guanylyltransferase/mannose-6-phosphate isomerase
MPSRSFHPVILCGGAGSRLWPASTPERPKAFLPLTGPRTLLQETALRVAGAKGAAAPILVVARAHAQLARDQLAELDIDCALISEPAGRGSGPAIAVAALEVAARDPDGLALVVACDHHIPDAQAFIDGVEAALTAAADGAIVTFGVKPSRPSEAYGHIQPGPRLTGEVRQASRFVEKPRLEEAQALTDQGWLWNSGNFVFAAGTMLAELETLTPDALIAARRARNEARRLGDHLALGEAFLAAPNIAIDIAVMEKTSRAAVLPVDYAWSDLGAWDAVLEALDRDPSGNAVVGKAYVAGSEGCLVHAGHDMRVVAVGLKDIVVVVERGRVLVCDMAHVQKVKSAAQMIDDG